MASTGALPQTLKSITATKISELSKQRVLFDQRKEEILITSKAAPDLYTRVRILVDGLSRLKGYPKNALDKCDSDLGDSSAYDSDDEQDVTSPGMGQLFQADHTNIRRFLFQGRYDASISDVTLHEWITLLEKDLRFLELKHEHADFYSRLVTEWLSNLEDTANENDESTKSDPAFENVGRAEMHEQRATWEKLVFNDANDVDDKTIESYLDDLFKETKLSREALKQFREGMKEFGSNLATKGDWLDTKELEWVSKALIKTDLLSDEKSAILKEFMRNKEVLQEVADVLNMRLASLENWSWGEDAIPVEMRRQLNGKYRVFMDEDLLDSLLLQYLGTRWAIKFQRQAVRFFAHFSGDPIHANISEELKERRKYFLGSSGDNQRFSINDHRKNLYKSDYFMSQLPDSTTDGARSYDDDSKLKNALEKKHSLLHLLITESIIQKELHGEFTAVRSDYQWFGPALSHTTILTVLKYFGVSKQWLTFFKKFLEAPMKFTQDGSNASTRVRTCGVPMSHTLSDVFGESVLFCMDYAVNKKTNGGFLYRLHDDFWFWGREDTCEIAWLSMVEFAKVMGLTFNTEKTGSVHMSTQYDGESQVLPKGDIRWGFLVLDAKQGRFVIDQKSVDLHIKELDVQLKSCKSVFQWVQAWNGYFGRFFANNFAKPAMCFGRDHIDMAVETLSRIERTLFSESSASSTSVNVTGYLRAVIAERFNIHDLPEGFFYYPVELGGLGLLNPFVRLLAMRENIKQNPRKRLERASLEDERAYNNAKDKFERDGPTTSITLKESDGTPPPFMSLEEYCKYPEVWSRYLTGAYENLLQVPEEKGVSPSGSFLKNQTGLKGSTRQSEKKGDISADWSKMTPYWRWVAEMYHSEMVGTYGSLAAVNREFMPLGVVKTLKEGRFRWRG
ncbi:hypothetical protein N7478_000955 [Penicillium angulare]|uniref:uncharacterized protein n=1 Tax=Penicillium angulare TaxID=116970 RepID=UPI002541501B|nr:uncharacterized protein N7478_000955 [Penicillium angulare]KAJ5291704.1 hypothetical protein N7478_000955 [Penicillium angulare]